MFVSPYRTRRPPEERPWAALLALLAVACGGSEPAEDSAAMPRAGTWRATLGSPGGPLTFGLELVESDGALRAVLINGEERRSAGLVREHAEGIAFDVPPYQSQIVAKVDADGNGLVGRWERDRGAGMQPVLPFAAVEGLHVPDVQPLTDERIAAVSGRWRARFAADDDDAVGIFDVDATGRARGTFLTTLGDYRYLAGWFDGSVLRLACFDGAHAFLFEAAIQEDGALKGDFWSRDSYHDTWTATKDADAELPDDFALTSWVGGVPLSELQFEGLDGELRALDDPEFAAPARLLVVFGTWCPNCNDLTELLVDLDERYDDLAILGLAFEMGDDLEAQRLAVRNYLAFHGATYPVLLCGTSDKAAASATLPLLDRVRAYPTTVFMDGKGGVTAVHTGFSGPATGVRHTRLRERFEDEIEALLVQPEGG